MMTKESRENLVHRLCTAISKATSKERRENIHVASPDEFRECWLEALAKTWPQIKDGRKPGRPKGTTKKPPDTLKEFKREVAEFGDADLVDHIEDTERLFADLATESN